MCKLFLAIGTDSRDVALHNLYEEGDDKRGYQSPHHVAPSHNASGQQDEYAVDTKVGIVGMNAHQIVDDCRYAAQSASDNLVGKQEACVTHRVYEDAKNYLGIVTQQVAGILSQ